MSFNTLFRLTKKFKMNTADTQVAPLAHGDNSATSFFATDGRKERQVHCLQRLINKAALPLGSYHIPTTAILVHNQQSCLTTNL